MPTFSRNHLKFKKKCFEDNSLKALYQTLLNAHWAIELNALDQTALSLFFISYLGKRMNIKLARLTLFKILVKLELRFVWQERARIHATTLINSCNNFNNPCKNIDKSNNSIQHQVMCRHRQGNDRTWVRKKGMSWKDLE